MMKQSGFRTDGEKKCNPSSGSAAVIMHLFHFYSVSNFLQGRMFFCITTHAVINLHHFRETMSITWTYRDPGPMRHRVDNHLHCIELDERQRCHVRLRCFWGFREEKFLFQLFWSSSLTGRPVGKKSVKCSVTALKEFIIINNKAL